MIEGKEGGGRRFVAVPEWEKMQHYRDRNPIWIKLYRELTLDNLDFVLLDDAAKWHVVGLWILAAKFDNRLPADAAHLQRMIGANEPVNLDALISAGFLIYLDDDASKPLASRKRSASKPLAKRKQKAISRDRDRDRDRDRVTDTDIVHGDASVADGRTNGRRKAVAGNPPEYPTDEHRLAEYVGNEAAVGRLEENIGRNATTAVLAMFGPHGSDPTIWRNPDTGESFSAEKRPAMLALAIDRYATEAGGKWDSRLFRRYLETVIRSTLEGESNGNRRGSGRNWLDEEREGLPEHLR